MICPHCQKDSETLSAEVIALRKEVRRLEDWGGDLEVLVQDLNEHIKTLENSRRK